MGVNQGFPDWFMLELDQLFLYKPVQPSDEAMGFVLMPVFVWLCMETHPKQPNVTVTLSSSDAH